MHPVYEASHAAKAPLFAPRARLRAIALGVAVVSAICGQPDPRAAARQRIAERKAERAAREDRA